MFIDKFSEACGLNSISINELSQMLENTTEVAPPLEEIHIKLLRKIKKSVPTHRWENALAKFAYSYSNQDAWELERFGYKNSSIAVKLRVLKALLEAQFDRNVKFKGHINGIAAEQLRSEPIGRDKFGNAYWCILDRRCNVHIFCENLDDETWKVVASNRDEVVQLIEKLKNNELVLTPSQDIIDEDTSSNSNLSNIEGYSATLKQDAKENSLIIERRVYKRVDEVLDTKKPDDKLESVKPEITEPKSNDTVVQESNKEVDGISKNNELDEDLKNETDTLLSETKESSTSKDVLEDTKDEKITLISKSEDSNIVSSEAIEEPVLLVKGEGSGVECEAQPMFSEVIEDPILFVYGPGNGIENQMGNMKTNEDSKAEETASKELHRTEKNDLPLKKKINRSYNSDVHRTTTLDECKDLKTSEKTENHSTVKKENKPDEHDESAKSSKHLESDLTNANAIDKDVTMQDNQSSRLKENEKTSVGTASVEKKVKSLDSTDSTDETSSSSYEPLLPKERNKKSFQRCSTKKVNDNDQQKPTPKEELKNIQKSATRTNTKQPNTDKSSSITDNQPVLPQKTKKGRKVKSGLVDGLDISQVILDKENGSPPIRQSRRIAQQKIQEETNRRLIEEKMLRQMKAEAMKKKKENKQKTKSDDDDEDYVVSDEDSRHTESKVKLKKKNDKPWMNSSSESSSETEPEEEYPEPEHSDLPSLKSDHEFSPESDLEDESVIPIKRARTARVEKFSDDDNDSIDSDVDHSCQKCGKSDHPEWILLCDSCDKGYHCSCLVPVLFIIPEGDWFCPLCQHEKLISNLQSKLLQFDEYYEKLKAEEALQKQIILQQNKLASEKDNGNSSTDTETMKNKNNSRRPKKLQKRGGQSRSSSSGEDSSNKHSTDASDSDDVPIYKLRRRNTSNLSYKLNEYDNLINSAIDRSTLESPESPPTHGKDIRNIVKAVKKEEEKLNRPHSTSPVLDEKKKQKKNPLKKKKKLNSLDVSSEEDDGSDEDFADNITSSDEDESFSMTEDSESSLEFTRTKKSRAAANKKKDRDFINDDDDSNNSGAYNIRKRPNKSKKILDDSDEFNEDDDVTESEEIDSEDLCNDTETDSSDDNWKKRKSKAKVVSRVPVRNNDNTKKKNKKADEDKTYKSGIRKRPAHFESDSDSSNKQSNPEESNKRRTRGKKLHYLIDDDFESSDDGITPGVHRPDTPPEEREKFIKKQEEIKRMLAEKNTAAAKELATPTIQTLHVNDKNHLPALSTIPPQVIENAKVLDIDFLRSSKHLDSDDFDEDLAANLPDPDVDEEELAKIMEEEDFTQHQLKLDDVDNEKDLVAEHQLKKKTRHFDNIDPAKITKPDKKLGQTGTAERKVDAVCSNLVNYLQSKAAPNAVPLSSSEVPVNKFSTTSPIYHSLNTPSGGSSSLLQQMKQQAIPLQDPPIHSTSLILNSKKPFPCTVPPLPPTLLPVSSTPLPTTPTAESKDVVVDVRRRRRKKITPLRGDLYKAAMDGRLLDPMKQIHYPGPPPSSGVIQTDKLFPYNLPKQPSPTVAPTFVTNSTKSSDGLERFTNSCPYTVAPGYNQGFGNTSSSVNIPIVSQPVASTLNEHPRRSFASLEPVNTEDPVPEQTTVAVASTEQNQNEPEGSSEFSGLVSYFSSQQNELNA